MLVTSFDMRATNRKYKLYLHHCVTLHTSMPESPPPLISPYSPISNLYTDNIGHLIICISTCSPLQTLMYCLIVGNFQGDCSDRAKKKIIFNTNRVVVSAVTIYKTVDYNATDNKCSNLKKFFGARPAPPSAAQDNCSGHSISSLPL